jgi:hypothetical protein
MGNDISDKARAEQTPVEQDFLGGEIGTGLGLWVSADIVEKHRGSMHVRSRVQPGKSGTTFYGDSSVFRAAGSSELRLQKQDEIADSMYTGV